MNVALQLSSHDLSRMDAAQLREHAVDYATATANIDAYVDKLLSRIALLITEDENHITHRSHARREHALYEQLYEEIAVEAGAM